MSSENLQSRSDLGNQEWRKVNKSKRPELHTFCTSLNSYLSLLIFCWVFGPELAVASFLQLIPKVEIELHSEGDQKARIKGSIVNQGDEQAFDVRLELVQSGQILLNIGKLAAAEKQGFKVELTPSALGIKESGSYYIGFRLLYRDANQAPFSAAFIVPLNSLKDTFATSPPIEINLNRKETPAGVLEMEKKGRLKVFLRNITAQEQELELSTLSSRELELTLEYKNSKVGPSGEEGNISSG